MRLLFSIAPFLYMILIWIMSSMPSDAVIKFSIADRIIKESLHLIEFAILYGLFVICLCVNRKFSKNTNIVVAVVSCIYGGIDEIHQYFVPYRSATWIDFFKDITGVFVLYFFVTRSYFYRKNHWLTRFLHFFTNFHDSKKN